jgi:hypothetical protein
LGFYASGGDGGDDRSTTIGRVDGVTGRGSTYPPKGGEGGGGEGEKGRGELCELALWAGRGLRTSPQTCVSDA